VLLEKLGQLNKSSELIGNRTREPKACSKMTEPIMQPRHSGSGTAWNDAKLGEFVIRNTE
jgi:hypothetical protein